MKSYKDFEKVYIGGSDSAMLELSDPYGRHYELNFGEDGDYRAYIADSVFRDESTEVSIGDHYKFEFWAQDKLIITSPTDKEAEPVEFDADVIAVYRAGMQGCIILLIHDVPEEQVRMLKEVFG